MSAVARLDEQIESGLKRIEAVGWDALDVKEAARVVATLARVRALLADARSRARLPIPPAEGNAVPLWRETCAEWNARHSAIPAP